MENKKFYSVVQVGVMLSSFFDTVLDEGTADLMDWAALHARARGATFWKGMYSNFR